MKHFLHKLYENRIIRACVRWIFPERARAMLVKWMGSTGREERCLEELRNTDWYQALKPGAIYIDCGMNLGQVAQLFVEKGAVVYGFEPNPKCIAELQKKFGSNPNVHLYQKGVLDKPLNTKLYLESYGKYDVFFSEESSIYNVRKSFKGDTIDIECIDLCAFIEGLQTEIDVLKLAVEGCEYPIVIKLIETGLYKKIKHMLVVTHVHCMPGFDEQDAKLRLLIREKGITSIQLDFNY